MIDEREVQKWIARLECEEPSWSGYEKLAVLYAIQNQKERTESQPILPAYSCTAAPETVSNYGDSDFLRIVEGKDPTLVWPIVDELMDTLHVVNERVYSSVMRKLRAI